MQTRSQEAVNRTKIVLKLLEAKRAASSLPPPKDVTPGTGPTKSGPSSKPSSAAARIGGAKARRDRCRPASVATTQIDRRVGGNGAGRGDDRQERRSMKKVLQASTEAYSDRVDREGGGAARTCARNQSWGKGRAAGQGRIGGRTAGGAAGGGGGERGVISAAAVTVQVAFRQRMFHRFVWAQAYLRSPAHAYGVFGRCFPASRGGGNGGFGATSALLPTPVANLADPTGLNTSTPPAATAIVPQLNGAIRVEDFDGAFLGYVRWRNRERSTDSLLDATSVDKMTGLVRPTAAASLAPGGTKATAHPSPGSLPQQQQQQQQRPEGAELFERKLAIRTAAVRSVLVDLRVPFLPGALDAAVEDLEKTIARENARSV
ncbi:unnamed protein product, partial [Hapterophycus canaliculatus]